MRPFVRPALSSDVAAIGRLRGVRFPAPDREAWARDRLRKTALEPELRSLHVGELRGRLVAYAVTEKFESSDLPGANRAPAGFYLAGIVVEPAARRQGVGTALVEARLDWIWKRSDWAYYYADDDNLASVALHGRHGFRPVAREFTHPRVNDPDSKMTLYALRRRP